MCMPIVCTCHPLVSDRLATDSLATDSLVTSTDCNMVGEVAVLTADVLRWDPKHHGFCARWPQLKTHKFKSVLFQSGANRFLCLLVIQMLLIG